MEDKVVFLEDIYSSDNVVVFSKGKEYEVLNEDKTSYYIQLEKNTNKATKFSKKFENRLYKFV
ncbi:hypothetical protein [Bacillus infantis]|uniref:hypothetical protein n=1 Tax=Bacillus infantis TaxID=324767 RepID=UPI0020A1C809|nr:hypothetical protein [Bacillus infantis]MCP1159354.1 hypothetical protein [Bacillus infantis]